MGRNEIGTRGAAAREPMEEDGLPGDRWRELVDAIGAEIAGPLTTALERVHSLTTTGRIERSSLRSLRQEVELAREAGIVAQQLARLASGRVRQAPEKLQLSDMLNGVLHHRNRETQSRGIMVTPHLKAAEVVADASLLFSLINATVDWALQHARSQIAFTVDVKTWPTHARLMCRFAHRPADRLDDGAAAGGASGTAATSLDSLTWRLLEQTAWAMKLPLERKDEGGETLLVFEFPNSGPASLQRVNSNELDRGFAPSTNSKPLAGNQVLIVASRREVRVQVRESIKDMGLIIDLVSSVEEAADFCSEGLPHAIIVEGVLKGDRLNQLRSEILAEIPGLAFIEIVEEGHAFEMSGFGNAGMAKVGRDAVVSALPSVLMYELSKGL
jgi:hypothetical protein